MSATIPRKLIDQLRESLNREAAAEARLQKLENEIKALKVALCEQACRTPDDVQPYLDRLAEHASRIAAKRVESTEATDEFLRSLLAKADPLKPDA